jgi:hypothetical protein
MSVLWYSRILLAIAGWHRSLLTNCYDRVLCVRGKEIKDKHLHLMQQTLALWGGGWPELVFDISSK